MRAILPLLAALATVAPGAATACRIAAKPPAEFATWAKQTPLTAGTRMGEGAILAVGSAAIVSLHPAKHLGFTPPAKATGRNGGTLMLPVERAGTYRIALGAAAWVDVVAEGKRVASVAHGHGPICTGITKMVDFTLSPGSYTVQLSGSTGNLMPIMVAKVG